MNTDEVARLKVGDILLIPITSGDANSPGTYFVLIVEVYQKNYSYGNYAYPYIRCDVLSSFRGYEKNKTIFAKEAKTLKRLIDLYELGEIK